MVPAGMHNRDSETKFQRWLAQYVNEACWSNHPHDIVLIGGPRGLKSSGKADSCVVGHLLFLFQGTLCALRPEIVGRRAQANMMRSTAQTKAVPDTGNQSIRALLYSKPFQHFRHRASCTRHEAKLQRPRNRVNSSPAECLHGWTC